MEEKNMRELNLEEMDKVSGGTGSDLRNNMRFRELPLDAQRCATYGYCPNCNPQMEGRQWYLFEEGKRGFDCYKCGFHIATE